MKTVKISVGDFIEFRGDTFQIRTARWTGEEGELKLIACRAVSVRDDDRIPFDLEAAKAGAPLVTGNGTPARFLAHVPEANENAQVLVMIEGNAYPTPYTASGKHPHSYSANLFMAAKPKRTLWLNFYRDEGYCSNLRPAAFDTKEKAEAFGKAVDVVAVAVPVEVEGQS